MSRYIHIADNKGRDAEVIFTSKSKKTLVKTVTQNGNDTQTIRVLKGTANNSYEGMIKSFDDVEGVAQAMITGDPEIDLKLTGRFILSSTRVYINQEFKPVSRISKKEIVYAPDGSVKEERIPKELISNILTEHALKGGKLFAKKEIYNKFVFAKKYQLHHINGLTFDFLFEIAKDLQFKDSLMMIGGGAKGADPLVFQDGGKTYRAFLEGRIQNDSYVLILHLSNLELKPII